MVKLFDEMTREELRQYAKQAGVKVGAWESKRKANLISTLRKDAEEKRRAKVEEIRKAKLSSAAGMAEYLSQRWGCRVQVEVAA